jgi:hypothetical protein
MNLISRAGFSATPIAIALTLAVAVGVTAQVATLGHPEETAAPEGAVETELEFADREEAILAFAACMRDNGIDMDDPVAGTNGGRGFLRGGPEGGGAFDALSEEFQVAQATCADILEAARPEVDPAAEQERLETELLLAACLRDNGYPQYPDPALDIDGRLQRGGQQFAELGIDRRSEAFQSARATCADENGVELLGPGAGPGPGRGSR